MEELSADIQRAVEPRLIGRQRPIDPHVLRFGVAIRCALRVDDKPSVGVELMDILTFGDLGRKERYMVVAHLVVHAIDTVTCVETGERVEMVVLVAALEDQRFVVNIPQVLGFHECRLSQHNGIVLSVVLGHHHAELRWLIVDGSILQIHVYVHLLVSPVKLYIRMAAHLGGDLHDGLHNAEIHLCYSILGVTILINRQAVIAALGDRHVFVGKLKPVMGIFTTGVNRVLIFGDVPCGEALQVLAGQQFATEHLDAIGIKMHIVAHLVE